MQIDWFTFIAQIVNFLIILALLKYFLYDRIVNAMDKREQKITDQLQQAEDSRKQAEQEEENFKTKSQELEKQRDEIINQAKEDAEAEHKKLIKKAKTEIEQQQAQWRKSLQQEQNNFFQNLRQKMGQQIGTLSRQILHDLADDDLEDRMIKVFIKRLHGLNEDERNDIASLTKNSEQTIIVRSSFEIVKKARQEIKEAFAEFVENKLDLKFETSSDLICGIEMIANGQKLAWSVDGYLDNLEQEISRALKEETAETDSSSKASAKKSNRSKSEAETNSNS
ncbi:MAG TPA: F0F1 ATP synthase subunit B [bacterium]|nr:F0F1 ATP synthase subunit B [bacterium]